MFYHKLQDLELKNWRVHKMSYIKEKIDNELLESWKQETGKNLSSEPPRDCRRPKTLRQYPYEKQTIPNRS